MGRAGWTCLPILSATSRTVSRRLRRRIRQEAHRADTWRRNYCYLQSRMEAELEAEKRAAVDAAEALIRREVA